MCEIGMRVHVDTANDGTGHLLHVRSTGMVIGHLGMKWAIVSLDVRGEDEPRTVLVPDGTARPLPRQQKRPVVIKPNGKAIPLSREEPRVRVRKPK